MPDMASVMDWNNTDKDLVVVREYACGCVIAGDWAPNRCPEHDVPVYSQSYARRTPREFVGWGGE